MTTISVAVSSHAMSPLFGTGDAGAVAAGASAAAGAAAGAAGAAAGAVAAGAVAAGVAARPADADAGHDLGVTRNELENTRCLQRHEVVLQVARAVPLVRMRRVLPLLIAYDVPRIREGRPNFAGLGARREPTRMIEVQV